MIAKDILDALSERGVEVESKVVFKNGVALTGIFLVTDSNLRPMVYFEDFKDMELGAAVSMIESELKKAVLAPECDEYKNIHEILKKSPRKISGHVFAAPTELPKTLFLRIGSISDYI